MTPFIILINFIEHTKTYTFLRHHTTVQWVCQLLTSQAAAYHRQSVHSLDRASEKEGTEWSQYLEKIDLHFLIMTNDRSQPIAWEK